VSTATTSRAPGVRHDVGAFAFRLRIHDSAGFLLGDAALLALAVATAVLRIAAG
jgi:hypothetical protein